MHRDLKLANILVHLPNEDLTFREIKDLDLKKQEINRRLAQIDLINGDIQVKIADLGFAKELEYDDMTGTVCGTPLLMAPEVLNGVRYNHKIDVWSLGIIFFELLTGFMPFTGKNKEELRRNLEFGEYKLPKKLKLSLSGLDFLNGCLQFKSEQRLSWDQLLSHPYISENEWEM